MYIIIHYFSYIITFLIYFTLYHITRITLYHTLHMVSCEKFYTIRYDPLFDLSHFMTKQGNFSA